jgi:hypothetical protein
MSAEPQEAYLREVSRRLNSERRSLFQRNSSSNFKIFFVGNQRNRKSTASTSSLDQVNRFDCCVVGTSITDVIENDETIGPVKDFVDFDLILVCEVSTGIQDLDILLYQSRTFALILVDVICSFNNHTDTGREK